MKRCEIDMYEFLNIEDSLKRKIFIESKLKESGFDLNKKKISMVDSVGMKYIYIQE